MKALVLALCVLCLQVQGQDTQIDSAYIEGLYAKGKSFWNTNEDSAVHYFKIVSDLAHTHNYKRGEANALKALGFFSKSNYQELQYYIRALEIRETIGDSLGIAISLGELALVYQELRDYGKMHDYIQRSLALRKRINDYGGIALLLIRLGHYEEEFGRNQRAYEYYLEALKYRELAGEINGLAYAHLNLGRALLLLRRPAEALKLATLAKQEFVEAKNPGGRVWAAALLAETLIGVGRVDDALLELQGLEADRFMSDHKRVSLMVPDLLSKIYESKKDFRMSLKYQKEWIKEKLLQDSLAAQTATTQLALDYEYKLKEREEQKAAERLREDKRRRANLQILIIASGVIILFALLVSGRRKIPARITNALTFISFLFLFEFLIVLIEPRLQRLTNEEPLLILLANALIALAIFPAHHFLEKYFRKRVIEATPVVEPAHH